MINTSMNENKEVLTVKDLSVSFGDFKVIDDLSFDVKAGDNMAIIGPNGAGKTVLFKALLDTVPYSGVAKWAPRTKIGYVPQRLDIERGLPITLREFLNTKKDIIGSTENFEEILELVGLKGDILDKNFSTLSGGSFQRALIAFALIGEPNVLLFDEPTASVDYPSEEQIYETLHRLQDEKKLTLILISHDLNLINKYSNKVLCLNKRAMCVGEPIEVLTPDNLQALYGGEHKYFHHFHDNNHKH